MNILAIQNCRVESFGHYASCLESRGCELTIVQPYAGERLPQIYQFDAVLIGGTPDSVLALEQHPHLRTEAEYLSTAVAAQVPCLGLCWGAQLLAHKLGADVRRCDRMEIGVYEVLLTDQGSQDPLLAGFPSRFPVFQWHGDTFEVPDHGTLLVAGDRGRNQIFRSGSVVGVQFHLEVSAAEAATWCDEYAPELDLAGKTKDQVVSEARAYEERMHKLAERLLGNFLSLVR